MTDHEKAIRSLAVSYHALHDAIYAVPRCEGSVQTWAMILCKAQIATGVMLMEPQTIEFWMNWRKAA